MGGSLRSGMDHVPGTGPHRVGMVTPSVESLHNPTQFGFDSTLDAVSRHCEKKLRCPIQSCLDAIKHIYIYIPYAPPTFDMADMAASAQVAARFQDLVMGFCHMCS